MSELKLHWYNQLLTFIPIDQHETFMRNITKIGAEFGAFYLIGYLSVKYNFSRIQIIFLVLGTFASFEFIGDPVLGDLIGEKNEKMVSVEYVQKQMKKEKDVIKNAHEIMNRKQEGHLIKNHMGYNIVV
jgi:hypothetical protein